MKESEVISFWKHWEEKSFNAHGMHKQIAISTEALEKQVPKKPVCIEDKMWTCGRCQNNLMFKWSRYPDILMPKEAGGSYCMECGQKIDWSELDWLEKEGEER